jgi:lysophospholipase L1-like esterase
MTHSENTRMKRLAAKSLAFVAFCVLVALALESAARLAYRLGAYTPKRVSEDFMQRNPYLFQIPKPGTRSRVREAHVDINSLGFRGEEFAPRKPPGSYRIFALGGSTTFGYPEGTPETADTYPFKTQEELRRRVNDRRIEVINAGVPGYTLRTSLVNYATRLTWYEPDLIMVSHGVNDMITFRSEDDLYYSVIRQEACPPLWDQIRDRSFLLLELNFRLYRRLWHPTAQHIQPADEPPPAALAAYERNLRQLVAMAQTRGVEVLIASEAVAIPTSCDGQTPEELPGLKPVLPRVCFLMQWYFPHLTARGIRRAFEEVARIDQAVAVDQGLTRVDLNAVVPKTAEYFWDMCHTRPPATTLIARALADALVDRVGRKLAEAPAASDAR